MTFIRKAVLVLVVFYSIQIPLFAAFPQTITDDSGATFVLKVAPVRILSLTLLTDELLLDLVPPQRLVGVTQFADNVDYSNVVEKAKKVPRKAQFTVESAIALNPDLVFVANWSDPAKVEQVRKAGIPVFLVATPRGFADLKQKISTLGTILGVESVAATMVNDLDRRLAMVEKRNQLIPANKKKSILDYNTFGSSSGRGSSWDEVVRTAGIINAAATFKADGYGQVPMSKELVLQLDPDFLALPAFVYNDPQGAAKHLTTILDDPGLRFTKAVRLKQVLQIPERYKSTVSQYMVDAVEYMSKAVYPTN